MTQAQAYRIFTRTARYYESSYFGAYFAIEYKGYKDHDPDVGALADRFYARFVTQEATA